MSEISHPRMPEDVYSSSGIKHVKYLNMLSKIAADIIAPVKGNTRISAAIVYRNNVVAFGVNAKKSHPFQAKFGKNEDSVYLHAETDAIKNALKYISIEDLSKSTLYICRVKFSDTMKRNMIFGLSKPCSGCSRCIATFGIRSVVYSLDNCGYSVL